MPTRDYMPDGYVPPASEATREPITPRPYDGGGSRAKVPPPTPWRPPPGYPPRPRMVEVPERDITLSGTVLDQVVPEVFGSRTVVGRIGAWYYDSTTRVLKIGVVFALGEQASITSVKVNGETLADAGWVTSSATHVGDGSSAVSSILTGLTGWTADDTTLWKGLCHCALQINCRSGEAPPSFQVTAVLGGRKVTPIGGGTATASTNPAVVAYHLLTSSDWRDLDTSKVDADSFSAVADWCDEVMSDASPRYKVNAVIVDRDVDAALELVLSACLGFAYVDVDGKVHAWAEMAPPPITGAWSATASATITEDSTSGAATTELAAGDYVYVGTNLRRVSSITNDDTVVLDSAVTVSGVKVRPITGIYIRSHHWTGGVSASESNLLQIPDKIRARFEDGTNRGSHEVTSTYGAGTAKVAEMSLDAVSDAGTATRITETHLKVSHLQPFTWSGVVRPEIGAALQPGDVVLFDDDVLTMQPARVLPPVVARPDGTYQIGLREYDPGAYSDTTDTTDTVPSTGTTWDTDVVPIHSSIYTVVSGSEVPLIRPDASGRTSVGNSSNPTQLDSSNVRLPNNVPLYGLKTGGAALGLIKVDTSDQTHIGDGSTAIYFDSLSLVMKAGTKLEFDHASQLAALEHDSTNNRLIVGDTSWDEIYIPCQMLFDNGIAILWEDAAGTARGTLRVTSGDDVILGDASLDDLYLQSGTGHTVRLVSSNPILLSDSAKFNGYTTGSSDPTSTNFPAGTWGVYRNTTTGKVFFCSNAGTFIATALN